MLEEHGLVILIAQLCRILTLRPEPQALTSGYSPFARSVGNSSPDLVKNCKNANGYVPTFVKVEISSEFIFILCCGPDLVASQRILRVGLRRTRARVVERSGRPRHGAGDHSHGRIWD